MCGLYVWFVERRRGAAGPPDPARWVGSGHTVTVSRGHYSDLASPERFVFRMLPGNIAYLSLDNFESDAGVKAFQQHLSRIMRAKGLILDVRHNGGGSSGYGMEILSYLTNQPVPTEVSHELDVDPVARASDDLRLEWRRLPDSGKPYVKNRSTVFRGPVAVLIGPQTFSAAEDFTVSFDAMKRGLLVGRTTAGSTGMPLSFKLPGGGSARVCVKRDSYPDGHKFVGNGIAPDVKVAPTMADIRAGRDSAVARAAALLRKKGLPRSLK